MDPKEIVKTGRSALSNAKPYFAGALWALKFIESEALPTAGVDDQWRVYYNPGFIKTIHKGHKIAGVMAVILHELAHLLRRHYARAKLQGIGDGAKMVWNVAVDMEINDDLANDPDIAFPKTIKIGGQEAQMFLPSTYGFSSDLSGEEYYDLLHKGGHVIKVPASGSGATGIKEEWEQGSGGPKGPSEFQQEAIRKDTARKIKEHVKSRGTVAAGWQRWAETEVSTKVDWRRELAAILRNTIAEIRGLADYSYRSPNRRQSAFGPIIMPSMYKPNPNPAVVIDTSGSMGEEDLSACLAELKGILRATGLKGVKYYACDAEVHSTKVVTSITQVRLEGGGGTDMVKGINAALEARPAPDLIIVLTDMYTPWPEHPTPCKLIACAIGSDEQGPAWAKTIKVDR